MLEIVICDSEKAFAIQMQEMLREFYDTRQQPTSIRIFRDGHSLMQALDLEESMDLVFLNTRLRDMSGFIVADLLRLSPDKKNCRLVFMSDEGEEVFHSFFYQPVWFIRKNCLKEDLPRALNRLWALDHRDRSIRVHEGRKLRCIRVDKLMYIASDGHYLWMQCTDGRYRIRGSMKEFEESLREFYFVHPTKSFLINCAFVDSIADKVVMRNGDEIPCSKGKKAEAVRMRERYINEVEHCL